MRIPAGYFKRGGSGAAPPFPAYRLPGQLPDQPDGHAVVARRSERRAQSPFGRTQVQVMKMGPLRASRGAGCSGG
jgi:hypothetical protein